MSDKLTIKLTQSMAAAVHAGITAINAADAQALRDEESARRSRVAHQSSLALHQGYIGAIAAEAGFSAADFRAHHINVSDSGETTLIAGLPATQ